MKVLLTHSVKDIGKSGELADVSDGYARNYLFPRKLAVPAQIGNVKLATDVKRRAAEREAKLESKARELSARLEGMVCTISSPADPSGNLYGSVTDREIVQSLLAAGVTIDRRQVNLDEHLRKIGEHKVGIKVSGSVSSEITVRIVPGETC
jgi:large subunit ribosomal protein L9